MSPTSRPPLTFAPWLTTQRRAGSQRSARSGETSSIPTRFILGYMGLILASIGAVMTLRSAGIALSILWMMGVITYHASRGNWSKTFAYFLAYLSLEGMFKYGTDFSQVTYAIRPVIAIICVFIWYLSGNRIARKPPFLSLYTALAVVGIVQIFHPLGGGPASSFAALCLWYLLPLPFYLLGFCTLKKRADFELILYACVITGAIVAGVALLQWAAGQAWTEGHFPGYSNLKKANWFAFAETGERVASWRPAATSPQPGGGSAWAHFGAIAAFCLLLLPGVSPGRKFLLAGTLFACFAGMFVSGVRLWIIASVIEGALVLFLTTSNIRQTVRNILLLVLAAMVLGGAYQYSNKLSGGILSARYGKTFNNPITKFLEDRGPNLIFPLKFVPEYPLGIGFQRGLNKGEYRAGGTSTNRETQLNSTLADLGVLGALAHFSFILTTTWYGLSVALRIKGSKNKVLALSAWSVVLGLNVSMLAGPIWQDLGIVFCYFAGAIFGLARIQAEESERTTSSRNVVMAASPIAAAARQGRLLDRAPLRKRPHRRLRY